MKQEKETKTMQICEVCGCEYEAGEEVCSEGMCPDCQEAYEIYHQATDWMQ